MTLVLDVLARSSVVLLAGLALGAALRSRSAALRHGVLAAALVSAVLVVPASLVVPSWTIVLPAARPAAPGPAPDHRSLPATPRPLTIAAAPSPKPIPARGIALIVWSAGCAVGIAVLFAGLVRLRRLVARGVPVADGRWLAATRTAASGYGLRQRVELIQTDAPFLVATCGLRPARVLLPPGSGGWTDERIHAVLCHELAHVARADWIVQIASQVVLAVLWFNPLAWLACRQLRRESELACDDAVLGRGVGAADYAGQLVALARECRRPSWSLWMPALPMARSSAFERRIAAMLNPRLDRSPLSRRAAVASAAALALVTLAGAAVRAVQAPAALTGTVYDQTGAVLPGVAVTLEDPQKHTAQATTDASGRFAFPGIGSGHYDLSASIPGFRMLRDPIDLTDAADWDRVMTLQVGALKETITVRERRIAATATPAANAPVRVRVGGNIRQPLKTHDVKPVYPASMRAAGREGQVPIEAIIGTDGSVSSVRVVSAQVHPDFAIAAVDAVRQWRFTPTLLNGQPVEVVMTVTVNFGLSD